MKEKMGQIKKDQKSLGVLCALGFLLSVVLLFGSKGSAEAQNVEKIETTIGSQQAELVKSKEKKKVIQTQVRYENMREEDKEAYQEDARGDVADTQKETKDATLIESHLGDFEIKVGDKKEGASDGVTTQEYYRKEKEAEDIPIQYMQVIQINNTLKKIIEENERLYKEKEELENQLRFMRGQRRIDSNRLDLAVEEMKGIRAQADEIVEANRRYVLEVGDLRRNLKEKDQQHELEIKEIKEDLQEAKDMALDLELVDVSQQAQASAPQKAPKKAKKEITLAERRQQKDQVAEMLQEFERQSTQLRDDALAVHYNIGNTYYHKGEYRKAAAEYQKALEIDPADAASHFNLAFVASEHLRDFDMALKHYREYLYLRPDAEDAHLVQEKILQAELEIRSRIKSMIEGEI